MIVVIDQSQLTVNCNELGFELVQYLVLDILNIELIKFSEDLALALFKTIVFEVLVNFAPEINLIK